MINMTETIKDLQPFSTFIIFKTEIDKHHINALSLKHRGAYV